MKPAQMAFVAVCCVLGLVAVAADAARSSGYEPALHPKAFSLRITNPYFPLPVGRTWVYRGIKDGQPQIDRVTVTRRTKRVAEGVTGRVVRDVATTRQGKLLEKTLDYYAQDQRGNVWYLGEHTIAYLPNGTTDTSGSWQAGIHDAEPGIIMLAHPKIPDAYRQEFLPGQAEDTAWIINRGGTLHVPFATLHHTLRSLEFARIEPGVIDQKIYAPGIGIISETALTGPRETAQLVRMSG